MIYSRLTLPPSIKVSVKVSKPWESHLFEWCKSHVNKQLLIKHAIEQENSRSNMNEKWRHIRNSVKIVWKKERADLKWTWRRNKNLANKKFAKYDSESLYQITFTVKRITRPLRATITFSNSNMSLRISCHGDPKWFKEKFSAKTVQKLRHIR